ncbi:nucleotidyltransferase family protein [Dyadobacter sp. CY323]|uniref:nucleotidyltransferase family protein n=1 Tax=Dyadobacter sp. CY323 TaxID=2907302 RepID=UPI001F26E45F|nr:nucleotidyltransferase domain-containing protein [Dyadobacter sp. CY323]MCE6991327.1 nucleotidyltransferase domain-containing protein [Dyadobacter sp. CY323]
MLQKNAIKDRLASSKSRLRTFGINRLGLFGSACRNDMKEGSDIDILIDFENDKETYINFIEACQLLESVFQGYNVDIVSVKGLSPFIGPHILKDVEYV